MTPQPPPLLPEGQTWKGEKETTEVEMLPYIVKILEKKMELNKISLILTIQVCWQSWTATFEE